MQSTEKEYIVAMHACFFKIIFLCYIYKVYVCVCSMEGGAIAFHCAILYCIMTIKWNLGPTVDNGLE